MRTRKPRVQEYHKSKTSNYVIEGLRVDGKRVRKFFGKRRDADLWLKTTLARMRKEGDGAVHMPEQLRVDAVACADSLKPYGKTLREATKEYLACADKLKPYGKTPLDAADHYLAYLATVARSCTVKVLISEFNAAKKQDGASKRYLGDLKNRLATFEVEFGSANVGAITSAQIDDWLRKLDVAAITRNNFRRILGVLFGYAVVRGYAVENVVLKTAKAKTVRGTPEIFTPEQMRSAIEKAPREFVPYLAIGAFAGLRSAEIERLDWSEIDLAAKLIHVKAEKAKSAQRRLVKMSDNLAAWLAPLAKKDGPVTNPEEVRGLREKTCKAAEITWPNNVLRHSFASYHLAHNQNAAATATELGHTSPAMLYKHYRELVRPDVAAQWWQVMPPADYGNVVAFEKAAVNG